MGVWEWITSGADTLKRRTAEATPVVGAACRKSYSYGSAAGTSVKDACLRGYGYGRAATATVDGAVRAKLEELPDGQSRHRFLMNLAKNGTVLIAKSCAKTMKSNWIAVKTLPDEITDTFYPLGI